MITFRHRDDDGQALLLALVFLALFGVWVASILGLSTTGYLSRSSAATQRVTTFAGDSAMFGAITRVRDSTTICSSTATSTSDVFTYQAGSSPTITVACSWVSTDEFSDVTVNFTATSSSTTLVTGTVVFYNSQIPPYTYGTQPIQITSWSDAT